MSSSETKIDGVVIVQTSTTGSSYLTPTLMYGGLSGSLQNLPNGTSYLVAGANVNITSQSNGQIVIGFTDSDATDSGDAIPATYGDGSDGNVTVSSNTTLTRDMYYASLTVNSGVSLFNGGYRVYVSGSCVISGTVSNDGGNGSNSGGSPGAGGAGGAAGTFLGGGTGGSSAIGDNVGYGVFGVNAAGGNGLSGFNGAAYTQFWNITKLGNYNPAPDPVREIVYSPAGTSLLIGGGSGGGSGAQGSGGGGGGVIGIFAHDLTVAPGGSIHANGGNWDPNHWGGGGGGGLVILVTATVLQNSGTIAANGGTGHTNGGSGGVFSYTLQ